MKKSLSINSTDEKNDFSFKEKNKYGDIIWRKLDGTVHRIDGPAVEFGGNWQGVYEWWYNGSFVPVNNQKDFETWLKLKAFF